MTSFFELGLSDHLMSETQLLKLDKLIDWSKLIPYLKDVHSKDGPLVMIHCKCLTVFCFNRGIL